jgi:Fe-S oxidoreductase
MFEAIPDRGHDTIPDTPMLALSPVERILFIALAAASGYGFWLRFSKVLFCILHAKKDPGFSLQPVAKRAWDFFSEVLCQSKVIRERPLPGLAHAFVFWGFCAFGLITLNHFAEGVGFPFLHHGFWLADFYFYLAGLFAVAVAVSIAGLFIRRFIVRPKWLGEKVSVESGFIAFLIFTLMWTYLVTFWPEFRGEGAWAKATWWLHTLALLTFLPLVPHTKHLHLVLSPVTVFLSRGSFSQIPPLVGDEDIGLHKGTDLTQLVSLQAYSCVECGRCTEHCPANNTGKVLNPKLIALGVRSYLNENGAQSETPLIGAHLSEEAVFQCTTCGACEYQCPLGIEHLPIIIGLRRGKVNTGEWEDDYGNKLFLNLEKYGNALGLSASEREKFITRQQFPLFDGSQEYLLWLGCMGAYDPQGREIIASFAKVMTHLGVTWGVLKKERCTGDPARRLGNDLIVSMLAEQNLENLKQNQVKKIVSICPHCIRTMSVDWKEYAAEFGEAPPIEHHSEFMARFKDQLPKQTMTGKKIVYHDPCYLGRYRGTYDHPREVINHFAESIDPVRARERSFCCGAGGGLAFLGEEHGERVSYTRAQELIDTGADVVGAACPFCNTMFRDAITNLKADGPQLMDIAQIAASSLPPKEKPAP